jgi:hypothetical protein
MVASVPQISSLIHHRAFISLRNVCMLTIFTRQYDQNSIQCGFSALRPPPSLPPPPPAVPPNIPTKCPYTTSSKNSFLKCTLSILMSLAYFFLSLGK